MPCAYTNLTVISCICIAVTIVVHNMRQATCLKEEVLKFQ